MVPHEGILLGSMLVGTLPLAFSTRPGTPVTRVGAGCSQRRHLTSQTVVTFCRETWYVPVLLFVCFCSMSEEFKIGNLIFIRLNS